MTTLSELSKLVDGLTHATDPVEIRVGSMAAIDDLPRAPRYPAVATYGLPIRLDLSLPMTRIEVRARDGSTLTVVDRTP